MRRSTWTAVALALVVSACGEAGERVGPPRVGDPVPDVGGLTLAGDTVTLGDLRGQPLLVNLWATWCPPCRFETPYLQELHDRFGSRGLRTVGISVDDRSARDQVEAFTGGAGVTYDILLDPAGSSMDAFQVVGLPATFLVDRDGVIRLSRIGPVLEADTAFILGLEAIVQE